VSYVQAFKAVVIMHYFSHFYCNYYNTRIYGFWINCKIEWKGKRFLTKKYFE